VARKSEDDESFRWLEVDLSDVAYLLKRHFRLLLLAPLMGLGLAWFASTLLRPVFSTKAVIFLRPNFDREMQVEHEASKLEDDDSLRSMERAIVSDSVIMQTVERLGLRNDPEFLNEEVPPTGVHSAELLRILRDRYKTKLVPNTRLVELTVEDYSPERSALIADTLVEEFLQYLSSDKNSKESERRSLLVTQAKRALDGALASEEELKLFRLANPGTIVEQDSGIFHERLLEHGKALNEANTEMSRLAALHSSLQSINVDSDPYQVFQTLNNRNSEHLSEILTMHATAKSEFAAVKERVKASHPAYREAESRLAEVNQSLRVYAGEMKKGIESEYAAARDKTAKLTESLVALQKELIGFKSTSAEFRGLKEEIDRHWNTYTRLQQKIMDLDIGPEGVPTFATVISKAVVPDKKAKPRRLYWAGGGMALGAFFALGLIYWCHRDGLPFTSRAQPTELLKIPIIAEFETTNSNNFSTRVSGLESSPQMMNLLIAIRGLRLIQVTSVSRCPGEGTLALAISRAGGSRGTRTLLLSFRNPPSQPDALQQLPVSTHVSLIELHPDFLLEILLDPSKFNSLVSDWLREFHRVVIDTTMVPEVEAKVAMGRLAQANLLVVSAGDGGPRSQHRQFVELCISRMTSQVGTVYLPPPSKEPRPALLSSFALPNLRRRLLPARPVSA
jgi:uncharacterized protein involved in exopolysaccharide biosynthesis